VTDCDGDDDDDDGGGGDFDIKQRIWNYKRINFWSRITVVAVIYWDGICCTNVG